MTAEPHGSHLSPDDLVLVATGHPDDRDRSHLAGCPRCSAEAERLARVVRAARVDVLGDPVPPPPGAWAAIAAAAGVDPRAASVTAPAGRGTAVPAPRSAAAPPLRRGRLAAALAAAAAVGLLAGAGGLWAATTTTPGSPGAAEQLSAAVLSPVGSGGGASGEAALVDRGGVRELDVRVAGLAEQPAGFHEVWLLTADGSGVVSLGLLAGDEGRFPVPPGVDVGRFGVVDVSAELPDGDPAHSSDSLLRGDLTAAARAGR